MIKSRMMKWPRHVSHVGRMRYTWESSVRKSERESPPWRRRDTWKDDSEVAF